MKFCQNKLCRAHVDVPEPVQSPMTFAVGADSTTSLRRMKIVNAVEKKEFDFCEVCANVLAIVHGKSN
jgi:hypothetical protein